MRLISYMNEQLKANTVNDVLAIVQKDCKQAITQFRKNRYLLYRGTTSIGDNNLIVKKTLKKNRKPQDIGKGTHKILDKFFFEIFGWKARSDSVICTNNIYNAENFSDFVYVVFPIGRFRCIWYPNSPDFIENIPTYCEFDNITNDREMENLRNHYNKYEKYDDDKIEIETISEFRIKILNKLKSIVKNCKTGDLNRISDDNVEIMMNCKEYYLIDQKIEGRPLDAILKTN